MDLSAIIDEFNRRKAQAGQRISDMFTPPKKPANWFQQMQQGQNAVVTPDQRTNINRELADMVERFTAGVVPEPIRARDRAMQTDPSAAAKPFTSEEVKGITPFVTAAAPIAYHGTPHTWNPPARTLDTLSEAIALSSPSGKMSQAARDAANERLSQMLFGKGGLQKTELVQPTHIEYMQKKASELRDLANRGMSPRKYAAEADRLDALVQAATKEAPDASKIGTGQGAQSYGHGLYFAENPQVAQSYADLEHATSTTQKVRAGAKEVVLDWSTAEKLKNMNGLDSAYSHLNENLKYAQQIKDPAFRTERVGAIQKELSKLSELKATGKPIEVIDTGNMYQVNIPDQHAARMLDWDKPLSEQPEIRRKLEAIKDQVPMLADALQPFELKNTTGSTIYRLLDQGWMESKAGVPASQIGTKPGIGREAASKFLNELGIPGIKYLDQGSRTAGQGTHNFVIFDPAILEDVTRK